jgi:type IV secretion system protein VirD4
VKNKVKIGVFIALSLVGLLIGFFFSGYINLLLTGGAPELNQLQPRFIMASLMESDSHQMLAICIGLVIEAGIGVVTFMSHKETYESDTSAITKGIKTPIAIGQGQHGTARWMNVAERRQAFSVYRLDRRETPFLELLEEGEREQEEVMNFEEETEKTREAADENSAENTVADMAAQSAE